MSEPPSVPFESVARLPSTGSSDEDRWHGNKGGPSCDSDASKKDEICGYETIEEGGQTNCKASNNTQPHRPCESRNDSDNDYAVASSRGETQLQQTSEEKRKGDRVPEQKKAVVVSPRAPRGKRDNRSETEKALGYLLEGVHILTRQMKNARSTFRISSATSISSPPVSEGDPVNVGSGTVGGAVGADRDGWSKDRDVASTSIQRMAEYESRDRSWSGCSGLSVGSTGHSSVCSVRSYASDDDRRLADITSRHLPGPLGADLMSLSHACRMVGENAINASSEAETAVDDVRKAIDEAARAQGRAKSAERAAKRLYQENLMLRAELDRLRTERKVLAKAVRSLREERTEIQRRSEDRRDRGIIRHVEDHVAAAITAHERQLFCARSSVSGENRERAASTGMLTLGGFSGGRKTENEKATVARTNKNQSHEDENTGLDLEDALAGPATGTTEKARDKEHLPKQKEKETVEGGARNEEIEKQPKDEKAGAAASHQATVLLSAKPQSSPFLSGMFGASASSWMKTVSNKSVPKKVAAAKKKSQISPAPTTNDTTRETKDRNKECSKEETAENVNEEETVKPEEKKSEHRGQVEENREAASFARATETCDTAVDKKETQGYHPVKQGHTSFLDRIGGTNEAHGLRLRAVSADNVGLKKTPLPPYPVQTIHHQTGTERVGRFFSNFNIAGMVGTMNSNTSDMGSSDKGNVKETAADTPQPSSLLRIVDTDSEESSNDESSMCSDVGSRGGGPVSPLSSAGPSPATLEDPYNGNNQMQLPSPSGFSLPSFASSSVEGSDSVLVYDDLGGVAPNSATSDAQQYIRSLALPKSLSSRSYRLRATGSWKT